MSLLLRCRNICKSYGEREILQGIDWEIQAGDRIGLVGRNGSGKSTLCNILAGATEPDQGQISLYPPGLRINLLSQDGEVRDGGGRQESIVSPGQMLSELKLRHIHTDAESNLSLLSGGERTRFSLARIWSLQPRLLILDEPTNNLDIDGMEWLIGEIAHSPAAVVIISHDRRFLDRTVTRIAEMQNGQLTHYNGNYSFYKAEKERLYQSQLHAYESQAREERRLDLMINQLKGWSEKAHRESRQKGLETGNRMGSKEYYRAKAKKKDQAVKSQLRRLEKIRVEGPKRPQKDSPVRFQNLTGGSGGRRLLAVQGLAKSYDGRVIIQSSDFWVNRGEKAAIIGPNGCGKSTLLKIITNQEAPGGGEVFLSPASRMAYIGQEAPLQDLPSFRARLAGADRQGLGRICTAMANLGLDYAALGRPSSELSHGERMKMEIALAIYENPDLIILDEPGNHLDLFSLESLEKSLKNYQGSLLLVSHDIYLVQNVCECLLAFENGRIIRRDCHLADYLGGRYASQIQPSGRSAGSASVAASTVDGRAGPDPSQHSRREQLLLLDTRLAFILGQLNDVKPGTPGYAELDARYLELARQKSRLEKEL